MKYTAKNHLPISTITAGIIASTTLSQAATIIFDFNNNTAFDNSASINTTMSATDGTTTVIATTIDILTPEYDATFMPTGTILSALAGGGGVTSIGSSNNSLGINNQSIGNNNYPGNGTEGNDFNPNESWIMEFDTDVTIAEFNFSSIGVNGGEGFQVDVEGGSSFTFFDGTTGDDFADPFSGLVITAGTNLTFTAIGTIADTNVRISEITVETIPEPSSTTLITLGGLALITHRYKH